MWTRKGEKEGREGKKGNRIPPPPSLAFLRGCAHLNGQLILPRPRSSRRRHTHNGRGGETAVFRHGSQIKHLLVRPARPSASSFLYDDSSLFCFALLARSLDLSVWQRGSHSTPPSASRSSSSHYHDKTAKEGDAWLMQRRTGRGTIRVPGVAVAHCFAAFQLILS